MSALIFLTAIGLVFNLAMLIWARDPDTWPLGVLDRIGTDGGPLEVPPRICLLLGLGVRELATNAFEYGALSVPEGRIELAWKKRQSERAEFHDIWQEKSGPEVAAPTRTGLGSRLLKTALAREIEG